THLASSHQSALSLATHACTRDLAPFPTRRSSDLSSRSREASVVSRRASVIVANSWLLATGHLPPCSISVDGCRRDCRASIGRSVDRKSTRLNSSHGSISYAVFCLK